MRNLELAVLIFEKYKINQYLSRWNGIDLVMKDSKYYFGFDKQFLLPIPYETAEAYSTGMLTGELIGRGYHSFEWDYDFNRELLFLDLYSKKNSRT